MRRARRLRFRIGVGGRALHAGVEVVGDLRNLRAGRRGGRARGGNGPRRGRLLPLDWLFDTFFSTFSTGFGAGFTSSIGAIGSSAIGGGGVSSTSGCSIGAWSGGGGGSSSTGMGASSTVCSSSVTTCAGLNAVVTAAPISKA